MKSKHAKKCRFRIASECPVSVECKHGFDVCPLCDPCTCRRAPSGKETSDV